MVKNITEIIVNRQLAAISQRADYLIDQSLGAEDAALLAKLKDLASEILRKRGQNIVTPEIVQEAAKELGELSSSKIEIISRALLLSSTIEHALSDFKRSQAKKSIEVKIEEDIRAQILNSKNPAETLDRMAGTKEKQIQSLTHTYHPRVYVTGRGKDFLAKTTTVLQSAKKGDSGIIYTAIDTVNLEIETLIDDVMKRNIPLTPQTPIDIAQEDQYEAENIRALRNTINNLCEIWNQMVDKLSHDNDFLQLIPLPLAAAKKAVKSINISDENKKNWQLRTWGRGGDSDGRKWATSQLVYLAIHEACIQEGGKLVYRGPTIDLRFGNQAKKDALGGLIQVMYRKSLGKTVASTDGGRFAATTANFVREAFKKDEAQYQRADWLREDASSRYIYDQLPPRLKTKFCLQLLLQEDLELLPKEIEDYVLKFNRAYREVLQNYGVADKDFSQLDLHMRQQIRDDMVDKGFMLSKDGRRYEPLQDYRDIRGLPLLIPNFLNSTRVLDGKGEKKEIDDEHGTTLIDVFRRLIVAKEAMTQVENGIIECPDGPICDRIQEANFSSAASFLESLLVLRLTGWVEIKDELVTKVYGGLQPLIETDKVIRNGPEIFAELLTYPVVISYFKERGFGDFMLGYSDAAKSCGIIASEWGLITLQSKLDQVFKDHADELGPDFHLRFFHGRGRGPYRGGTIDSELGAEMMPYEIAEYAINDETIQGDHPGEVFTNPDFAIRDIYGRFIGTIKARERAFTITDEGKQELARLGEVMTFLRDYSSSVFQQKVRRHPDIEQFINGMPFNNFISTRNADRPETAKVGWEQKRAVPIEEMNVDADLPFLYVGFGEAINAFINSDEPIITKGYDEDAEEWTVTGTYNLSEQFGTIEQRKKLLSQLTKHSNINAILERAELGMTNFHPEIASLYADITGAKELVNSMVESLTSLQEGMKLLKMPGTHAERVATGRKSGRRKLSQQTNGELAFSRPIEVAEIQDVAAHLLTAKLATQVPNLTKIKPEDNRAALRARNNLEAIKNHLYAEADLPERAAGVSR